MKTSVLSLFKVSRFMKPFLLSTTLILGVFCGNSWGQTSFTITYSLGGGSTPTGFPAAGLVNTSPYNGCDASCQTGANGATTSYSTTISAATGYNFTITSISGAAYASTAGSKQFSFQITSSNGNFTTASSTPVTIGSSSNCGGNTSIGSLTGTFTTTAGNSCTITVLRATGGATGGGYSKTRTVTISGTYQSAVTSSITPTTTSLALTSITYGKQLTSGSSPVVQSQTISTTGLSASITATAPNTNIQVSSDGTTFGNTATVAQTGGTLYYRLAPTANVGSYSGNITLASGSTNGSITITSSSVTAAALTVTATAQSKNYGAVAPTAGTLNTNYTVSGLQNSDAVSGVTLSYSGSPAGNLGTATVAGSPYTITPNNVTFSTGSAGNYSISYPTALLTVNKATLTVSGISIADKVYTGTNGATISGTPVFGNLQNGESFTPSGGTATFNSVGVGNAVPVTITGYAAPSNNYTVTQPTGLTGKITPAPLTITGVAGVDKTYDGTTTASLSGTATYSGLVNGESFSVTGSPVANFTTASAGGTKPITVTGYTAPNSNYTVTQPTSLTASINKKGLSISGISINDKTYDGNTSASITVTPALVGVIASDNANVILDASGASASFADALVGNNKPVTVTGYAITGSAIGNYMLSQPTGLTANITSAALKDQTITFNSLPTYTYGDAPFNLAATASSNLSVTYTSSNTSVATISGNTVTIVGVGTTTITAEQAGDGTTYNPAPVVLQTLTVNPKQLTVVRTTVSNKVYSGTTTAAIANYTLNGIVGTDNVTVSGTAVFADKNVGNNKAITTNFTLGGIDLAKYTVAQPTNLTASIAAAPLTISGVSGVDKVYDGLTTATLSGTPSYVGLQNGETFTVTGTVVANLVSANMGNTIAINVSGYTAPNNNYSLTQPTSLTANINAATLTITGVSVVPKNYDGKTTASLTGTPAYSGLKNGESFAVVGTPTPSFATAAVGVNKAVTVTGYQAPNSNYTVTQPNTLTATISAVNLTITGVTAVSKGYDGTTTATLSGTPAYQGLVNGESFSVTGTGVGAFTDANVGTGKTVTVTGYTAPSGNYTVTQPTGLTADITKGNQTITFNGLAAKTTNDIPFNLTGTASSGLTVTYTSSNTAVAIVSGSIISIIGAGTATITASQAGNSNYNAASSVQQTLTVNIAVSGSLVTWINGNSTTNANMPTSFVASGISATASPSGLSASSNGSRWSFTQWQTSSNYILITVSASTGYSLNLNGGSLVGAWGSSNTGPGSFSVYSLIGSNTTFIGTFNSTNSGQTASQTITLPSTGYDGLSTISFKVFGSTTSAAGGSTASTGTGGPSAFALNGLTAPSGAYLVLGDNGTQTTTQNLTAGSTGNVLAKTSLVITNNTATITSFQFTAAAASTYLPADITGFKLYRSTSNTYDGNNTSPTGVFIGSAVTSTKANGATENITFTTTQSSLPVSQYYYYLVGDISASATNGRTIIINGMTASNVTSSGNTVSGTTSTTGTTTLGNAPILTSNTSITGSITIPFTYTISATQSPTSFTVTSGALPDGLTLSNAGVISGTPTVPGFFTATITGSNTPGGASNTATYAFNIKDPNKADQTITFTPFTTPVTYSATTFNLSASTTSPLAITFISDNTNVATISGNTVTLIGAGSATISATQAGNSAYNPAPTVSYTLTVNKATLNIGNPSVVTKSYDGTTNATITGTFTIGSGLVYAGDAAGITLVGTGTYSSANAGSNISVTANCSITGNKASNYTLVQPTGLTGTINKANQLITFNSLPQTSSNSAGINLNSYASANTGLSLTYSSSNTAIALVSGSTLTPAGGVGTVTVTATQVGNANYNMATATQTQVVILGYCSAPAMGKGNTSDYYSAVSTTGGTTNFSISGLSALTGGYSYFNTASAGVLTVGAGNKFKVVATNPTSFSQGTGVWLDANNDGTFSSTEFLGQFTVSSGSSNLPSADFTVPSNSITGTIRMRVILSSVSAGVYTFNGSEACTALGSNYGETMDFDVTVVCGSPIAVIAGTATICNGNSTNITATVTGGRSPFTVAYTGGSVSNYTSGAAIAVSPATTTSYTLGTITDTNGCTVAGSGTATVTVNALPTLSGVAQTGSVCSGNNDTITLSGLLSGVAQTVTYTLNGVQSTATLTVTGTIGTFTVPVTYTTNNGQTLTINSLKRTDVTPNCPQTFTSNNTVVLSVTPIPTAIISYAGTPFCKSVTSGVVTLTGTNAYTGGAFSAPTGLNIDTASGIITPSSSTVGTYTVIYTIPASGGCSSVLVPTYVTIQTVSPITGLNAVNTGATIILKDVDGNHSNAWSSANPTIATINTASGVVQGVSAGSTVITYTATNGCSTNYTLSVYGLLTWTGSKTNQWNYAPNWSINRVPLSSDDVNIPSGTLYAPSIPKSLATSVHNLIVAYGAVLSDTGSLSVSGFFANNGTIKGTGVVVLNGTTNQTLGGVGTTQNLKLNNTAGATISTTTKFNVNGVLTVAIGTLTTSNNLTLKSTSITSSAVVAPVTGKIVGGVIVERFIPKGNLGMRDLCAGVANAGTVYKNWQESGNYTNGYGTFITGKKSTFNGQNQVDAATGFDVSQSGEVSMFTHTNGAWKAITGTKNTTLDPYRGYRVYIRGNRAYSLFAALIAMSSSATLRDSGNLITDTVVFTQSGVSNKGYSSSYSIATGDSAYTLLANPYVAPINWDNLTKTGLSKTYSYLDPTVGGGGGYTTWNTLAGTSNNPSSKVNKFIQAGQGFFVQNDHTNGSVPRLTITENDKSTGDSAKTAIFGAAGNGVGRIAITLWKQTGTEAINYDGAVAVFSSKFSNGIGAEDAKKLMNNSNNLSIVEGGTALSINGRANAKSGDVLPIQLSELTAGTNYSIKIDVSEFDTEDVQAYLLDKVQGTTTVIDATSNTIDFTPTSVDAASYKNRFSVIFGKKTTTTPIVSNTASKGVVTVYPNPVTGGTIHLSFQEVAKGNYVTTLYNSAGQIVTSKQINHTGINGIHTIELGKAVSKGTYTLQVKGEGGNYQEKVMAE